MSALTERISMAENDTSEVKEVQEPTENAGKKRRKGPRWLRVTLKTLMWTVIVVLLLPVLLYIPPVQDLAVRIAKDVVKKSTGMEIGIGEFRLGFPLDVHLKDVYVLTEHKDTMVRAGEAVADIGLLPLLRLDVKVNRLDLVNGYYRMVSPDSSMILTIDAGHLTVDDKSSVDIARSRILLNKVRLADGNVGLYMDVWKKKPTPEDTVKSTPFYISANDIEMENFRFGMSMLPTIDTLSMAVGKVALVNGVIDLGKNTVTWRRAGIEGGEIAYIVPTAEYIKNHPAPPSEPSTGPPMQIMGDSISVRGVSALYATKGMKPAPGFDPSYISVSGVEIGIRQFYNEASTVKLPLTRLQAKERSGLQIVNGRGLIAVDSIGLNISGVSLQTLYSRLHADAEVPFALMALEPDAPMTAQAGGRLGLPDIEAFMPALKEYTAKIPGRKPLEFKVDALGTLLRLSIRNIEAEMAGVLRLKASGKADNPLDYRKMRAQVAIDGALMDPRLAEQFLPKTEMRVPAFAIKGTATADGLAYGADLALTTTAGDLAAKGHVALTPETYHADITASHINVAQFMPSLGIGRVSATVNAHGAGFNPLNGSAVTDADVAVSSIEYQGREYRDITANVVLSPDHNLKVRANSDNPGLSLNLDGEGTILPDNYTVDLRADIRDLDLMQLGFTDSMCNGKGKVMLAGNAQPGKWLYDADLKLEDFDWNMPGRYIHLPGGAHARVQAEEMLTRLDLDSHLTSLSFESPNGLQRLIASFMATADTVMAQAQHKNIAVDAIKRVLPQFRLDVNASGRGLLGQVLMSSGIGMDTVWAHVERDSLIHGSVNLLALTTGTMTLDTLGLALKERGQLLDYHAHMGNRPGTLDEFAEVNVKGYLGHNRLGAYLTQKNISGEQGYRLGLTAAMMDSTVSVHFTPLKATIAYMPWTLNNDNYIDYNFNNMQVDANLQAMSRESSIMARTEPDADGGKQLRLQIANVHIEDFMRMSLFAPPVKGSVSSDLAVHYRDKEFQGGGTLDIKGLQYENTFVGNLGLDINGRYGMESGNVAADAALRVDGRKAMIAYAHTNTIDKNANDSVGLTLTRFPLRIANAFLGNNARLSGFVNGDMRMSGKFSDPVLNGHIAMDSARVYIPMAAATLRFDTVPITVAANKLQLEEFDIYAANENPLTLAGTVDAGDFNNILFDVSAHAANIQLIKSDKRSKGDIYGKIFMNLDATVKGPMQRMDIYGNVNLLGTTDATYRLNIPESQFNTQADEEVVKFVNFSDTTQVADADTVVESSLNMRVNANVVISPGTQLQVLLSTNGTDKLQIEPSANLHYYQSYMGDMTMNGTLTLGNGFIRYAIPVMGEKMFDFNPSSTITWTGNVTNPTLNVTATDLMKASVTTDGNSRLVNFLVTLHATQPVDRLKVAFDLSTNDDLTILNELQSMTPDQRQTQAMNLLLYGQYTGQGGTKANANIGGNVLYSFLESQLNSWAAKNIRGVDLTFGVDQYDVGTNGNKTTNTSYSYQVSKSLFNNRFKIRVGGNYSTDQNAEDNLAQNLISDISFEYILKQTQTMNMSVELFRHQGYESILEGEITETGVAFTMKRKLSNLLRMFRFRRKKKKNTGNADTRQPVKVITVTDTVDTVNTKENIVDGSDVRK